MFSKLIESQWYPSYPSAAALTQAVLDDPKSENDIMHIKSGLFTPQLQQIMDSLPTWKQDRPHGPKAALSVHDTAVSTSKSYPTRPRSSADHM